MLHGDTVTNYCRKLDLDTAMATVTYEVDASRYMRESFVSMPAQVMVVRLTCGGKVGLNAVMRLKSGIPSKCVARGGSSVVMTGDALGAIFSLPARARGRSQRTCKASGARICVHRGAPTGPPTSTYR